MSHAIALPASNVSPLRPVDPFEFAAAGFLAAYRGRTLEAYTGDLKCFFGWCASHDLPPLQALRAHLELFVRWMEDRGYASATINRRFNTVALFYAYATDEEIIDRDPARRVKRPRIDYDGAAPDLPHAARARRLPGRGEGDGRHGALPRAAARRPRPARHRGDVAAGDRHLPGRRLRPRPVSSARAAARPASRCRSRRCRPSAPRSAGGPRGRCC